MSDTVTRLGPGTLRGDTGAKSSHEHDEDIHPVGHVAEAALLGACLLIPEASTTIAKVMVADDFDREAHRTLFLAIRRLIERDEPCDVVSVTVELADFHQLDEVGGPLGVSSLLEPSVTAPESWVHYVNLVQREAQRRDLIGAYRKAIRDLQDGADPDGFELPEVVVPV